MITYSIKFQIKCASSVFFFWWGGGRYCSHNIDETVYHHTQHGEIKRLQLKKKMMMHLVAKLELSSTNLNLNFSFKKKKKKKKRMMKQQQLEWISVIGFYQQGHRQLSFNECSHSRRSNNVFQANPSIGCSNAPLHRNPKAPLCNLPFPFQIYKIQVHLKKINSDSPV